MSIFSEKATSSTLLAYAMIIVTELFLCCARERERVREGGGREGFFSGSSTVQVVSQACRWIERYRSDPQHVICISYERRSGRGVSGIF